MKGKGEEDMTDDTFDLIQIFFEEWKPVPTFPQYEVSSLGRIRKRQKDGKWKYLKPTPNKLGYCCVTLSDYNHNKKTFYLHRLVAEAFLPNPNHLLEINHLTEVKAFNEVYGIEWTTRKLNCNYGTRNQKIGAGHSKVVEQYSLDGRLLATYSSTKIAAEHCHMKASCIAQCARGDSKTAYGYVWKYKETEIA